MNTDNDIREFFQANRPEVSSADDFFASLSARLDAVDAQEAVSEKRYMTVEEVRKMQEEAHRRSRIAIAAAFGIGVIAGICLTVYFFFNPLTSAEVQGAVAEGKSIFSDWKMLLTFIVPCIAMAAAIIPTLRHKKSIL